MRLISIIGTDGSGKTSLSDLFAESLREQGIAAERVWLGAESQLMKPVRAVLRRSWSPSGRHSSGSAPNEGTAPAAAAYSDEISRKNQLVERLPQLTNAYVTAAWTDYRLQTAAKFWRARKLDVLIADRYLFDVAVNIGLTLGWSPDEVVEFCQRRLARLPLPQARFFLRVTPEVSMSRKDDIPDISYLRLRLSYYDAIAAAFGFEVLDGTKPFEENLEHLHRSTRRELDKPYVHYVHANNEDVGGADRVLALMAQHAISPHGSAAPVRASVSLREPTGALELHTASGTPVMLRRFVRPQTSGGVASVMRSAATAPISFAHFFRLFGREKPDVVHVNDLYDVVPAVAARARRIPVVYHIRMIKTSAAMRRAFSGFIPRISSASISVSEAVRDHYFEDGAERALVIHDLGNESLVARKGDGRTTRPAPLGATGWLVVMVGRVEPWKGQNVFLDAVEMLDATVRESNTFAMVGGAVPGHEDFFERVETRAGALGVQFLGERRDVPDLLAAADVSVHCSVSPDPFPGVVVESMLAGALTIGADAGGVRELISSTEVGMRSAPGDAEELAECLRAALSMDELQHAQITAAARQHVLDLVAPSSVDEQISSLYKRLSPHARGGLPFNDRKVSN